MNNDRPRTPIFQRLDLMKYFKDEHWSVKLLALAILMQVPLTVLMAGNKFGWW